MIRQYRRIAQFAEEGRIVEGSDGRLMIKGVVYGEAVYHPDERDLLDSLQALKEAKAELESAEAEWSRLESCC